MLMALVVCRIFTLAVIFGEELCNILKQVEGIITLIMEQDWGRRYLMVNIREAVPNDAEAISELNDLQMGYSLSVKDTYERLCKILASKKDKIFVAAIDGKVAGYVHANDYDVIYFPHMKNIMGIAVDDKFRRQGIGSLLINAVETWARNTNAAGVRLVSGVTRTGAHEFYRHCGFGEEKEQINFKKVFD